MAERRNPSHRTLEAAASKEGDLNESRGYIAIRLARLALVGDRTAGARAFCEAARCREHVHTRHLSDVGAVTTNGRLHSAHAAKGATRLNRATKYADGRLIRRNGDGEIEPTDLTDVGSVYPRPALMKMESERHG